MLEIQASLGYPGRAVLDDLALHVGEGEMVALTGVNGVGKSTLLRAAAGLLRPRSGTVTVGGGSATDDAARDLVGFLPDAPPLYEELTAFEHVELLTRLWRRPDVGNRADELIDHLELEEQMFARADQLSSGQRKRLSLALTLAHRPRLLLLDEPFNGLDRRAGQLLRALFEEHRASGGAMVCATHLVDHLDGVATRLVVLSQGRVTVDAQVDDDLGALYDQALERQGPDPHGLRV